MRIRGVIEVVIDEVRQHWWSETEGRMSGFRGVILGSHVADVPL
jgi:hypothetical protein